MAEGRKEILRHRTIVAKIFRVVTDEVPARKLKTANFSQHVVSIYWLKVFLLALVRNGSKRNLPFDHRNNIVSQADFVVGIDEGSKANGRSIGQIRSRHIGAGPNGGVIAARAVGR